MQFLMQTPEVTLQKGVSVVQSEFFMHYMHLETIVPFSKVKFVWQSGFDMFVH
jgi:hypothetical protein